MQTKLKLKTKNQRADEPRLCYNDNYYIYIYHTLSTYTYIYIYIYIWKRIHVKYYIHIILYNPHFPSQNVLPLIMIYTYIDCMISSKFCLSLIKQIIV